MSCGQPRELPAPELCRHHRNHYPNLHGEETK